MSAVNHAPSSHIQNASITPKTVVNHKSALQGSNSGHSRPKIGERHYHDIVPLAPPNLPRHSKEPLPHVSKCNVGLDPRSAGKCLHHKYYVNSPLLPQLRILSVLLVALELLPCLCLRRRYMSRLRLASLAFLRGGVLFIARRVL